MRNSLSALDAVVNLDAAHVVSVRMRMIAGDPARRTFPRRAPCARVRARRAPRHLPKHSMRGEEFGSGLQPTVFVRRLFIAASGPFVRWNLQCRDQPNSTAIAGVQVAAILRPHWATIRPRAVMPRCATR